MHPKIRLKPTPYDAKTSAFTASDVVYGESPNQTERKDGEDRRGGDDRQERPADSDATSLGRLFVSAIAVTVRAARVAG